MFAVKIAVGVMLDENDAFDFKCGRIILQLVERALAASVPYHRQQVWKAAVDLNFP